MNDQDKHIDRIFQEGLKQFEPIPSGKVWNQIEARLQPKKKRLLPFWFKSAGIAAAMLVAFGLGYWFQMNTSSVPQVPFTNLGTANTVINTPSFTSKRIENASMLLDQLIVETETLQENQITVNTSNPFDNFINTTTTTTITPSLNTTNPVEKPSNLASTLANIHEEEIGFDNNASAFLLGFNEEQDKLTVNESPSLGKEEDMASTESSPTEKVQFDIFLQDKEVSETKIASGNWYIKPVIAPIFNAGNNASSALGTSLSNTNSSGDVSFSYGMQVGFSLPNRWSIRTGINQVNTSYTTQNVVYAPSASAFMPASAASAYGVYGQDFYSTNLPAGAGRIFSEEGSLSQQMNFIEIPLEIEYALLQGKFGISLSGGASTLLLTNNALMLSTTSGMVDIGELQGTNQTSFTTNLGVGFSYQVTKKINFNVEPGVRYQLDTFQDDITNFNPYFFGIYSGLQFKF